MPLCRICHTEQHKVGIQTFVIRHQAVALTLQSMGWEIGIGYLWHEALGL